MITIELHEEQWPILGGFAIARGRKTHASVIYIKLGFDGAMGQGECVPYAHYAQSLTSVRAQIEDAFHQIANCTDMTQARARIHEIMPAGAGRNALDCALWDLQAKHTKTPVWQLLGLAAPKPVTTAFTLGIDTPDAMAQKARANSWRPLLKIKMGSADDYVRLQAVRDAAPDCKLIIDANEGWKPDDLSDHFVNCLRLNIAMIEQPLPAQQDAILADIEKPIPLCADESAHTSDDLDGLMGKYQMVNIKLDKTGGLSEALRMKTRAQDAGFGVMVGCMLATSLAMAPAILLVDGTVSIVDLDGPLLLKEDRAHGLQSQCAEFLPASPKLWG